MHLEGFRTALTKTFNDYARTAKILKDSDANLSGDDILGLILPKLLVSNVDLVLQNSADPFSIKFPALLVLHRTNRAQNIPKIHPSRVKPEDLSYNRGILIRVKPTVCSIIPEVSISVSRENPLSRFVLIPISFR